MENTFTVITGASRGLGISLARECAARKRDIIIVSLPHEGIFDIASELSLKYGIRAIGYEADLTSDKELASLVSWIKTRYRIDMLINNAGMGGTYNFMDAAPEYINNIMMLNMKALVMLTHSLLPLLKQQSQSFILNIASIASFGPMPFKTVYPASKAFVYSFSRGLNAELAGSTVFVSVAHPGAMATTKELRSKINLYRGWIRNLIITPEKTAEICINKLLKKRSLIIPGFLTKMMWIFFQYVPIQIRFNIFRRVLRREIKLVKNLSYAR
jgi:uncharacterized protein